MLEIETKVNYTDIPRLEGELQKEAKLHDSRLLSVHVGCVRSPWW